MIVDDRYRKPQLSRMIAVGLVLFALGGTPAVAADVPTSSRASDVAIEVVPPVQPMAPLTPPPGMSVTPSSPKRMPVPADDQSQGCPVKELKPLDLLV